MKQHCKEVRDTLQAKIANDEALFEESQTKLAFATEKEATAGEEARQTAAQNSQLEGDLKTQMKTCSTNYINFETEICALKKIRGELYKMQGSGHSSFFQDCEVSKWEPEECSTECKASTTETDGEQKLTRNVMTHPDGGASCLPLEALKKCNLQPCPVDCKLEAWTGWSKCSAECGGGVQQRLREGRERVLMEESHAVRCPKHDNATARLARAIVSSVNGVSGVGVRRIAMEALGSARSTL